jgi:hypothetical protein
MKRFRRISDGIRICTGDREAQNLVVTCGALPRLRGRGEQSEVMRNDLA